jgi:hypothetical protein
MEPKNLPEIGLTKPSTFIYILRKHFKHETNPIRVRVLIEFCTNSLCRASALKIRLQTNRRQWEQPVQDQLTATEKQNHEVPNPSAEISNRRGCSLQQLFRKKQINKILWLTPAANIINYSLDLCFSPSVEFCWEVI